MAIFMSYEGIEGEHMLDAAPGFIQLQSISWGMSRNSSSVRPSLRSRVEPSIRELSCLKTTDASSVALLQEALTGKFDRTVSIQFVRQGTGTLLTYVNYMLFDVGITSFDHSGSGEGTPMETFTLNFTTIQFNYTVFADDLTGVSSGAMYSIPDAQ